MGFTDIVKLIDDCELTSKQKSELRRVLRERKGNLKKALNDVETALKKLEPKKSA